MDPENPIVQLCAAGMDAENGGQLDEAHALFQQAWSSQQNDLDACIAAHFLARHQADPTVALAWNQRALDHAALADASTVGDFYPSLYLNLGWSHEQLGDLAQAQIYYERGAERLADLPVTPYSQVVRRGLAMAQQRMDAAATTSPNEQRSPAKLGKVPDTARR